MGVDQTSLDRIRNATFPASRRGYDKHEVEKFLGRLADWLETGGGDESRSDAVKKELERVGQRTGAILAQAEESAEQIRGEAEEEARGTVNSANLQATESRTEADNYANETRTEADRYSTETKASADRYSTETKASADREGREAIEAAQAQARQIVEEANQRREDMEALIGDLVRRRQDVIADTEELSRKLTAAVEQHRAAGIELPEPLEPPAQDEEPELEPEETEVVEDSETEVAETRVTPESQDTEEDAVTTEREITPEPRPEHRADLRT